MVRTPVGQSYISEAMIEHRAVIGGEGNGGVAVPRVLCSHDAAAAQGLILEHMARTGATLRALVDAPAVLRDGEARLRREAQRRSTRILQGFRDEIEREALQADATDGMVVSFADGWVHVRASQTESMIRVIAEGPTPARARDSGSTGRADAR